MNPRQALKSLETLARARDLELTDLRREAAQVHAKLARLDQIVEGLNAAIDQEGDAVGADPVKLTTYAEFTSGARKRIKALKDARAPLSVEADAADARVMEAFRALKQIEEAAEARRREIEADIERKERAEADDLATLRALRARAATN